MKIVILDAQGGGMGRQLVEGLKKALPNQPLIAVGTNALATAAMLRAGADQVATGENAVMGFPRALMGFLTPYIKARFGQGVTAT